LKKGGSLRFDYEFSDMLTGSCKYEYSDYHQYSDYRQGYMNIVNIGATHDQHLSIKKIVLYHTVNMLVIEGDEDKDERAYIAKHLYMPSYIFRLSYPVSDEYYSGHIAFKIGMGYLFGIDNDGFALSPGCSFDLRVHEDVGLTGGAEYRLDEVSGEGEWRTNVGVEILF